MLFDKIKFDLDAVFSDNSKALHFFSTQPKFNYQILSNKIKNFVLLYFVRFHAKLRLN